MKKYMILLFIIIASTRSFADGQVKTETAKDINRERSYSLLLYGARHGNDLETAAILDIEGDDYTIEVYAPDFDYKIERGADSSRAIERAREFVSWHPLYTKSVIKRIAIEGKDIGYEIRPLYDPLSYGISDVMDIDYRLRDKRVFVRIRLLPQVERMLHDGDRLKGSRGTLQRAPTLFAIR